MTNPNLCTHFFPSIPRRHCDAGMMAPLDCAGCPAYFDASDMISEEDAGRVREWEKIRGERIAKLSEAQYEDNLLQHGIVRW